MSWAAIARKDFEDAVRSWWLLGLSALFVVLVSGIAYVVRPGEGQTFGADALLNSLFIRDALVTTLIPLIALITAYRAVVGERESGSLKLLLSLPHSRADVVFGKVAGRAAAVATPIVVGFLLPGIILLVGPLEVNPLTYLGYTLLVAFLGAVFVAIAVGFSAAVSSGRLAVAGAVGVYFLFVPLWGAIRFPIQLYFGLGGGPEWLPITGSEVLRLLQLVNPTGSFKIVANAFLAGNLYTGGDVGFQTAATSMLLGWLLLPPLLGLLRFEREDL